MEDQKTIDYRFPDNEWHQEAADRTIKDIRRQTRRKYTSEDKIRIVLSGLKGEDSIAELCRQKGIAQSRYYGWSKEVLEAGKKRPAVILTRKTWTSKLKAKGFAQFLKLVTLSP